MISNVSVDPFLNRVPHKHYNCFDLCREFWMAIKGEDVRARLMRLAEMVSSKRIVPGAIREFTRLRTPESPCFVVMQRDGVTPHIGIYWKGRVLHLSSPHAEYQPVATAARAFSTVRFYK